VVSSGRAGYGCIELTSRDSHEADRKHAQQARSPAFPFLPLEEIERFLARRNETDETTWIRSFRAWVKTLEQ
jgi:hypothetical protein